MEKRLRPACLSGGKKKRREGGREGAREGERKIRKEGGRESTREIRSGKSIS